MGGFGNDKIGIVGNGNYATAEIRHRMFAIVDRTRLNLSHAGIDQALSGQIVTNPADRQALGQLLQLIAEPSVSQILIGLLVPAVQRIRGNV